MKLENSKGTKDFPPEEKIVRNEVVNRLITVFEKYGYSPLETPIIERYDLFSAKAGAGEESDAMKEVFTLEDQGGRKLGLKFEQTLSFARFIGMNPNIKMPFKRYEIGPVFRDGPIKLGRYRQFWQCDADIVGCKGVIADADIISLSLEVFKELGLDAYIEVNNRKLLRGIIEFAGIKPELADSVIISIDKLKKIGESEVRKELEQKKISDDKIAKLLSAFNVSGSYKQKIEVLKGIINNDVGKQGLEEIKEIFNYLSDEQKKNVVFNVSLARGLGYYTGPVFEGFMRKSKVTSSICGGGRYDNMIPMLLKTDKEYPCTGISFGVDVITDVFKEAKQLGDKKTVTQSFVIPIKTSKECFSICRELRNAGINADMDLLNRGISKNLAYANSMNIPYVIIIGAKELEQKKVNLRNMKTGKEELLSVKEVIEKLK
ncbi:MAG: histidine--tRNA ligase [Nanoarchaeota archaeon]|nr:histidine--tRNA ligase [Nanoarchaeota archaeon]MBU1321920.1 histidine--tRNA ligase [Nanoarchaeota archaeon]MBU1597613.1 histidine--tRNA ligase [Nanoarchaeota archaeon]MBU2440981.1 histidine--tRNA ligase [Nanoarchaeota archaeon]